MRPARFLSTALLATLLAFSTSAQARDHFSVCWSIYVGWMPWAYADAEGIIDKWADKYDIDIELVQVNDYIESINQYTSGNVDGCAMTNMDALTLPAASGVDSTALIINDYSNGNDGIVLKGSEDLADIKGRQVNLVQFSVSNYLLARALETVGLTERDIEAVNTADADVVAIYPDEQTQAVVTWNPQLSVITGMDDANLVFTSRQLPTEILDMMVVNTQTLAANPDFGRALVGAWYEVMDDIKADNQEALALMAEAAGTDLAGYRKQLAATYLYTDPAEAASLMHSQDLLVTMQHVAEFSHKHGLLGPMAPNAGFIGVETPQGVYGDENNIMLRFDPRWTEEYIASQP